LNLCTFQQIAQDKQLQDKTFLQRNFIFGLAQTLKTDPPLGLEIWGASHLPLEVVLKVGAGQPCPTSMSTRADSFPASRSTTTYLK
jgi:hypothetical protein